MIFRDDPGFFHGRIVGAEVHPGEYLTASSGSHEYVEEVKYWEKVGLMSGADSYPVGLEGEVMSFIEPWSDAQILTFVKRMREMSLAEKTAHPAKAIGKVLFAVAWLEGRES